MFTKICPKCKREYEEDALYCDTCGISLILKDKINYEEIYTKICPNCENRYIGEALYCDTCGIKLKDFNTYLKEKELKLKKDKLSETIYNNNVNPSKTPSHINNLITKTLHSENKEDLINKEVHEIRLMKIKIINFKKDWMKLTSEYINSPKELTFKREHKEIFDEVNNFKYLKEIQIEFPKLNETVKDVLEIKKLSKEYIKEIRKSNKEHILKEQEYINRNMNQIKKLHDELNYLKNENFNYKQAENLLNKETDYIEKLNQLQCLKIIETLTPEYKEKSETITDLIKSFKQFQKEISLIDKEKNKILILNQKVENVLKDWEELKKGHINKIDANNFKNKNTQFIKELNELKYLDFIKINIPELKNEIKNIKDVKKIFQNYEYNVNLINRDFKQGL
ncbi:zinc ribbon domain-containing protein [Methanobrevibacter acididurans]|uniref:double zinc ribbon domain-containing protein n=1 Tax=Methanobrevibacter acididurans TaxID=120963 RepID=UPI0038FC0732